MDATDLIITPDTQPVITVKNYFRSVLNKDAREMKEGDSGSPLQFTTTPNYKHVTKIGISDYQIKSVNVGTLIDPRQELRAVTEPVIECTRP